MADDTAAAFADPQPGDSFHEMFTFRMFVIAVEPGGRVAVMTATPPCTLPDDGKVVVYPDHDAYRQAFSYDTVPGYWVTLGRRGVDVTGWWPGWPPPAPLADCPRCATLLAVMGRG